MQSPGDVTVRSGVIRGSSSTILREVTKGVHGGHDVSSPGPWVEAWLSPPRFGIYLSAGGGDRSLALELYEWNAEMSAALQHDLAHLEVALRNAYDVALAPAAGAGKSHWTLDAGKLFPVSWQKAKDGTYVDRNKAPRDQLAKAVQAAGPSAPSGKVIAELTFGFWRYLSTRAHHQHLWIPYLHKAFATGTSRPQVDKPIGRLHKLRNRVAHHEPLLRQDLAQRHADLLSIAALISSELHAYVLAHSRVPSLLLERPIS